MCQQPYRLASRPEQLLDGRPVLTVKYGVVKANTRGRRTPGLYTRRR